MKRALILLFSATALCAVAAIPFAADRPDNNASPIFGVTIPDGYRHWELVATSHEAGSPDELRGILGNGPAMNAYREGKLPLPEGAIVAKLTWKHLPSAEDNRALGKFQAFVPGRATTVRGEGLHEVLRDRRLEFRAIYRWQASGRGAA